ncbi:hypothetical protein M8J76_008896 [Diaphorina citri]|nr:hypothetical protein M8J76_008896 [Diaphorina citri]
MRFKKNPTRLPYSDELLEQQSLVLANPNENSSPLNGVSDTSKEIKKSNKTTAISNAKVQKRLKLQRYRDKLSSESKQGKQAVVDEGDERLIDFLRKYNEIMEKQSCQNNSISLSDEQSASSNQKKKSSKRSKLTKLQRVMKDLECTMVQGNTLPNKSKPNKEGHSKRGILKTKKMNMLLNYKQQKLHANNIAEEEEIYDQDEDVVMSNFDTELVNQVGVSTQSDISLDEFKMKLISSVIEKDEWEEKNTKNKINFPSASREEETPLSALIKSNEMQMWKSSGIESNENEMDTQHNGKASEGDASKEEEIVDEKVRRKIEKQLHIDVTDKYNFLKQTARTKLRPKSTPDFEMNKRFRKNRYRIARNMKLKKKNLLSENICGQNHFLGFDKSIKRFKDEKSLTGEVSSDSKCLVNRSYFNWDGFTVATEVKNFRDLQGNDMTTVGFRDEMEFLMYSLVNKKAQSTLNARLQRRLELWMKICKTRKDLQVKTFREKFHLIENAKCENMQNCDKICELLGCEKMNLLLAVPSSIHCPYLDISSDAIDIWKRRLNGEPYPILVNHTDSDSSEMTGESKEFKSKMRNFIKQMILQKQLRCNSTYAAYDISNHNPTNLYEDECTSSGDKLDITNTGVDESLISCKTGRISYYTSGNYINVSVNLQSPMKKTLPELQDSESTSLASSYEDLPQAHIAKIEELYTDETSVSNDLDEIQLYDEPYREPMETVGSEIQTVPSENEVNDCTNEESSETEVDDDKVKMRSNVTSNLTENLDVTSNLTENPDITSNFTENPDVTLNFTKNLDVTSSHTKDLDVPSNLSNDLNVTSNYTKDLVLSNKSEHNGLISSFLDFGNGQNTKRKKGKRKKKRDVGERGTTSLETRHNGVHRKCQLQVTKRHDKGKRQKYVGVGGWRKILDRRGKSKTMPRQTRTKIHNNSPPEFGGESNSNSYESMYDIVKTKTRHSLSKSIFSFENCKFPRKDGDVFYTSLSLNVRDCSLFALMKSKRTLPDFLSRYTVMSEQQTSLLLKNPKFSLKMNKFTKLQIFVIYLKNMYFLFFKK